MSTNVLVAGDLHLSDRIWSQRPIFDDSYYALDQIVGYACAERPAALILAGDILNTQVNPSKPILRLKAALDRLEECGVPTLYVQGQHDYQGEPWLSGRKNTHHLQDNPFVVDGLKIMGHDFAERDVLLEFLPVMAEQKPDIFVAHQVWRDFMGDMVQHQLSFDDVPETVRCVVSGDYHVTQTVGRRTETDETRILLSPGSTHMRSISEPADKYMFRLVPENGTFRPEPLPLRSRRVIRVRLEAGDTLESLFAAIDTNLKVVESYAKQYALPEAIRHPILVLEHAEDTVQLVRGLQVKYSQLAHVFYVDRSVRTNLNSSFCDEDRVVGVRQGLQDMLPQVLDPQTNSAAFNLAAQLLNAEDKKAVLDTWYSEKITGAAR